MLGVMLMGLGLFYSHAVGALFAAMPKAILGVILLFAGGELAASMRHMRTGTRDVVVTLVVAAAAMWNIGAAFVAGVILHAALRRARVRR
jgi:MFS superfamily sulfate permease-like transporter